MAAAGAAAAIADMLEREVDVAETGHLRGPDRTERLPVDDELAARDVQVRDRTLDEVVGALGKVIDAAADNPTTTEQYLLGVAACMIAVGNVRAPR